MKRNLIYLGGPFFCAAMLFTACMAPREEAAVLTNRVREDAEPEAVHLDSRDVEAVDADPHNVMLIIADDYGVDMAALYNSAAGLPPTPNIDALFDDGVLFENAWTNPICTPTRAAMLTGRYGFRTGVGDVLSNSDVGLQLTEFTLPEAISAGSPLTYTHANIGKWHLSTQANGGRNNPNMAGYDHFSGLLRGGLSDYNSYSKIVNGTAITVTNYATTETVDDAIDWLDVQNQQDKPWFLWMAFNAPHSPFHLPPTDLHSFDSLNPTGEDNYDYYKAMVEAMDTEIGRLLGALPADVRANTTVIFIGDNGSPGQVVQSPLSSDHAKGSVYDGGVNVPLIVSGPKVVDGGRRSDALVNSVDMYATVLELMEIDVSTTVPDPDALDSVSMLPYLTNTTHTAAREWIYAERFDINNLTEHDKSIRDARYKLIHFDDANVEFYDLDSDPYEAADLLAPSGIDGLSAAEEIAYCGLYSNLVDLIASETGATAPTLPLACNSVATQTPTPTAVATSLPTDTPTATAEASATASSTAVPTETPVFFRFNFLPFIQGGGSDGSSTSTPTPTATVAELPTVTAVPTTTPTSTPIPTSTPTPSATTTAPAPDTPTPTPTATIETIKVDSPNSICNGVDDLSDIPAAYLTALTRYTTVNAQHIVNVCTEDINNDNTADFMVIESTNLPEHNSVYFETSNSRYEDYDYETNLFKFAPVHTDQNPRSAGSNQIEQQAIILKLPINPVEASSKTATSLGPIGLALNGVTFYNEQAAPDDNIVDELFTFDQCSGHPQGSGMYHYHVDPVCLIRDLGGDILTETEESGGVTYTWIADSGNNAELLLGFLLDGFPVYGPIDESEVDCNNDPVTAPINEYNGHVHCTDEFPAGTFHYHSKTANIGGTHSPVFWITNEFYYGEPGVRVNR